ncbi:hypothetical protein WA158_002655 [Blastocystis sp. Blastoise]
MLAKIDNIVSSYKTDISILSHSEMLGITLPRFCYHNKLMISANCRVCLCIVEKERKPVTACSTMLRPGIVISLNTPQVSKLREDVLEFLLINHPLDCPTCDQGGECDLQDMSYYFGLDKGRNFGINKKAILNKDKGPLIKTVMNRCINCTRCVRFVNEIAGSICLGSIGRGRTTEIGSYVDSFYDFEISGNLIDVCPVGALTSKPYAFTNRPWELKSTHSIDVMDGLGSSITINTRGSNISRIIPRNNDLVNEEWISDKIRFSYDGLNYQRISNPMIRINNKLQMFDWDKALNYLQSNINSDNFKVKLNNNTLNYNVGCYFGELLDNETIFMMSNMLNQLGCSNKYTKEDLFNINNDLMSNYRFNTTLKNISKSDMCILIGTNPKLEASVLNIRLRKLYTDSNTPIITIGSKINLTYPSYNLGFTLNSLIKFTEGRSDLCKVLQTKKRPSLIIGSNIFINKAIYNTVIYLNNILKLSLKNMDTNWNYFNILHDNISSVGKYDISLTTKYKKNIEDLNCLFLLNVDNDFDNIIRNKNLTNTFVIYQGHHYNKYINMSDLVLPNKTFVEKDGTYTNTEGRTLFARHCGVNSLINTREDWSLLNILGSILFKKVNNNMKNYIVNSKHDLINTSDIFNASLWRNNPNFKNDNNVSESVFTKFINNAFINNKVNNYTFSPLIYNFYLTNNISRASRTMAECSKSLIKKTNY